MTLPPTSVRVIVWCGDTPVVLRSLGDRCERHKRAIRAWSARWPASPKGRIKSEPRGPSQLRGVRGVSTHGTVPITNRHDSSWFESFRYRFALFWSFWLAISEPGWTSRKKVPLGTRLKSTRPSQIRSFVHKKVSLRQRFPPVSWAVVVVVRVMMDSSGAPYYTGKHPERQGRACGAHA